MAAFMLESDFSFILNKIIQRHGLHAPSLLGHEELD